MYGSISGSVPESGIRGVTLDESVPPSGPPASSCSVEGRGSVALLGGSARNHAWQLQDLVSARHTVGVQEYVQKG